MIGYVRTLLLFYRRHLRAQPLRELMAVVGVAAGVALLFAVQVAHRSVTGSFEQIAHGVAGRATLEVAARGPEGFDGHVSEEAERLPGVSAVAPILERSVVVSGPRGRRAVRLIGATEQLTALGGTLARQFQRIGEATQRGTLVLTAPTARAIGAHPGSLVALLVGERTEHLPLDATISSRQIGPLAESPIAAAPLAVVQAIAGGGDRTTRVLVEPQAGREASVERMLAARYGSTANVRPIGAEAKLLANASGPERQITLLFGAISLVAGIILAYNALLLAGDERRRFVVYLIESGAPDSTIVASLAFDALVLGVTGSLLGLLLGDVVSLLAYRAVPGYIAAAFAIGGQRIVGGSTIALALGGGVLAAFGAAALPAISALRAGASVEPDAVGRTLSFARRPHLSATLVFAVGAALVCASLAVAALAPQTTVAALVGLAAGLVLCTPTALRGLLSLARRATRRSGDAAARVAIAELRSSPARSVALLATGTIAVFLMVLIGGAVADVQHAVRRGAADLLSGADVWIRPGGPENVYTTEPFAYAQTARRLERLPAVRAALPWRNSFLDVRGRRVWVVGAPTQATSPIAPSQLLDGSLGLADSRIRAGGWIAISQTIAHEDHLRIGQRFELPTPSGFVAVRIAATVANYGWLPGAIVMNGEEHARLWRSGDATQLGVQLAPGTPLAAARAAIESALPSGSALSVETAAERRAEAGTVLGSTLARLNDTTVVVLIAAITSVIALMIAAIWQRRARLDSLVALGMSVGQLARLIFYESGTVLLAGCAIGMAAGLAGQALIDGWLRQTTGSPVEFAPAWQLGLRTIAIAAAISAVASLLASLQGARLHPRAVLSLE